MLLYIIIGIVVLVSLYQALKKPYTFWSDRGVKQSKPVIIFGDNWGPILRLKSFADTLIDCYNEHPDVRYSGFYQFFQPTLIVKDPDLLKQMTVKDFDHFTDHRQFVPEDADPLWAKNLFALTGKKWRDMRATLSPSFTSSKMRYMYTLIEEAAENFTDYFKKLNQDEIEVEFKDTFTRFTNDVIATAACGIKVDSLTEKENEFYLMGRAVTNFRGFFRMLKIIGFLFFPSVLRFFGVQFFSNKIKEFFLGLTMDTIKVREEKNIVRPDMIHLLMEARKGNQKLDGENNDNVPDGGFAVVEESEIGKKEVKSKLEDMDIAAQVVIFFLAGFDTVSSLMCFLAYELAINPEVQNRLRQEIRETLKDGNGKVTYETLLKMQYLDMVVSEALRKWPPVSAMDRVCTKPYTIKATEKGERDVQLPVGTIFWLPIFALHRDPNYYPNPEKFDPERFNDDNKSKINPYTYMPFGSGPRNCIGSRFALLETKAVFFHLLNSFEIVPNKKSEIPFQFDKTQFNISPVNGFHFSFKRLRD